MGVSDHGRCPPEHVPGTGLPHGRTLGEVRPDLGIVRDVPDSKPDRGRLGGLDQTWLIPTTEPVPEPGSKIVICSGKGDSSLKSRVERKVISKLAGKVVDVGIDALKEHWPASGVESADALVHGSDAFADANKHAHRELVGSPLKSWATNELGLPSDLASPLAEAAEHVPLPQDSLIGKTVKTLRWASVVVEFVATGGLSVAILDLVRKHLERAIADIISEALTPQSCEPTASSKPRRVESPAHYPSLVERNQAAAFRSMSEEFARRRAREADEKARQKKRKRESDKDQPLEEPPSITVGREHPIENVEVEPPSIRAGANAGDIAAYLLPKTTSRSRKK